MHHFWKFYQQNLIHSAAQQSDRALNGVNRIEDQVRQLESTVDHLKLINVAFAELFVEKLGVTEKELLDKINEIDLRDGVQDGKLSPVTTDCSQCKRRYNSKRNKCLYCGYSDPSNATILDKGFLPANRRE